MSKPCNKCGEVKPLSGFHKNKNAKDGLCHICKECNSAKVLAWQLANPEKKKAKQARYNKSHPEINGAWYRANPGKLNEACAKYRAKNPIKRKVYKKVQRALISGQLKKDVLCKYCGTYGALEAHHCNYDKPLDVQWLCVPCHRQWHVTNGPGANG